MNYRIERGAVVIGSIHIKRIDEDSLMVSADLSQKRCEVGGYEWHGEATTVDVDIADGQETPETPDEPTRVTIEHGPGEWEVIAEVSRYTLRILALRCAPRPTDESEAG